VGVITCAGLVALATAGAVPNRTTVLLASQSSSASGGGAVAAGPAGAAPGLPTVLVVGDSVANSIASGAQTWGGAMHVSVANGAVNGCALTDEITGLQLLKKTERNEVQLNAPCAPTWLGTFERVRPAAVAIVFGNAAGFERFRLGGAWVGACDAAYARWYGTEMAQMVSTFRGGGATVTMATLPYPDAPWLPPDARQRIDCMNGLIRGAATRAGVAVVDLGRFVCPAGRCVVEHGGEPVRSDGVHFGRPVDGDGTKGFSGDGSRFVGRWLLQEVLDHGTGARRA
jgi:hypothetical protein